MTDPRFEVEALRLERLGRLQAAMGAQGVDVCVLFHEPNIRYPTGATAMSASTGSAWRKKPQRVPTRRIADRTPTR